MMLSNSSGPRFCFFLPDCSQNHHYAADLIRTLSARLFRGCGVIMVYIIMIMLRHGSYPWCAIWGLCWCIFCLYFPRELKAIGFQILMQRGKWFARLTAGFWGHAVWGAGAGALLGCCLGVLFEGIVARLTAGFSGRAVWGCCSWGTVRAHFCEIDGRHAVWGAGAGHVLGGLVARLTAGCQGAGSLGILVAGAVLG